MTTTTGEVTPREIMLDFERAVLLENLSNDLRRENSGLMPGILENFHVEGDGPPGDFFVRSENPNECQMQQLQYFSNLAILGKIGVEVAAISSRVYTGLLSKAVIITPLEDRRVIEETYLHLHIMQQVTKKLIDKPVKGTVVATSLEEGTVTLEPQKYTRAGTNEGYYIAHMVDTRSGTPLVDFSFRKPEHRDRPKLYRKILGR